ncbi:hypothetical protein SUDANB70_05804 [Streptomyces sp. enrichment culture]
MTPDAERSRRPKRAAGPLPPGVLRGGPWYAPRVHRTSVTWATPQAPPSRAVGARAASPRRPGPPVGVRAAVSAARRPNSPSPQPSTLPIAARRPPPAARRPPAAAGGGPAVRAAVPRGRTLRQGRTPGPRRALHGPSLAAPLRRAARPGAVPGTDHPAARTLRSTGRRTVARCPARAGPGPACRRSPGFRRAPARSLGPRRASPWPTPRGRVLGCSSAAPRRGEARSGVLRGPGVTPPGGGTPARGGRVGGPDAPCPER